MKLRLKFTDFWPGFIPEDNYFYNLLSRHFETVISDSPDILFFSCYGEEYLGYDCLRIYYCAENMRPDFTGCDFALSFDYLDDPRHYRLPLYALYIDQRKALPVLLKDTTKDEAREAWRRKTKFCCMVVSNGLAGERTAFFHHLSKHARVDSGGRFLNNVGGAVADKLAFIRDYKFVIAFENSSSPGYTTEKILEPLLADCIPVYWGNPRVGEDFSKKRFLDRGDFSSDETLIAAMMTLAEEDEKAIEMLMEPKFPGNRIPSSIVEDHVLGFLKGIIAQKDQLVPVARTYRRNLHYALRKKNIIRHYLQVLFRKNFR